MSAVQRAKDVLALPSTSKGTVDVKRISASVEELAGSWCEALRSQETSEEDKKLILRALRVSKLPQTHGFILSEVPPLLANSSPSIRLQTAGALLQYSNLASSAELSNHVVSIVTAVNRCLSSLRITIQSTSSPSSSSRLVATCLRILNTLVSKILPLPSDSLDIIAPLLGHWVYHGPSSSGNASPAPARVRYNDNSQLSFGVMSSFAQTSISPKKIRRPLSPARSSRSETCETSESESEDGRKDRRADSAQIRLDALTCLRSLALNNPRALQKHWHHFLSDSPYMRNRSTLMTLVESDPLREVRIQACQALEAMLTDSTAYLAIAQDRPTKASFTSLSTKVGEIVGELHLALNSILARPVLPDQTDVRVAVLKLAARLASCSPYGRMTRSLADPLAKAVLSNLDNEDPAVLFASVKTLTAIVQRHMSTTSSSPLGYEMVVSAVEVHADHEASEELQIAAWTLLTSSIRALPERDWSAIVALVLADFEGVSPAVQASRAKFFSSFFYTTSTGSIHTWSALESFADQIPLLLRKFLDSTDPTTRIVACSILPHPHLASSQNCHPLVWVKELMYDHDQAVSQAAYQALGLILRESKDSNVEHREAVAMLMSEFSEKSDGDISWALANACDALTDKDAKQIDFPVLVDRAMILLVTPSSDERIQISCVRILGSMLRLMSKVFKADDGAFEEVLGILSEALDSPIAKIRWNTCSSLIAALPHLSPAMLETDTFQLLFDQLATILAQDPSYKVRIHSASLLSKIIDLGRIGEGLEIDSERVGTIAKEASSALKIEMEEGKVSPKEKRHVEILIKKLETLVEMTSTSDVAS